MNVKSCTTISFHNVIFTSHTTSKAPSAEVFAIKSYDACWVVNMCCFVVTILTSKDDAFPLKIVACFISDTCRASPEGGRHFHVKSFSKATYCLNTTVTIIHLSPVCLSPSPSLTLSF